MEIEIKILGVYHDCETTSGFYDYKNTNACLKLWKHAYSDSMVLLVGYQSISACYAYETTSAFQTIKKPSVSDITPLVQLVYFSMNIDSQTLDLAQW